MMKNSFFKIFLFLTFFCCEGYVFSQKQNSKKPQRVNFVLKNPSLLSVGIIASSIGACLYADIIQEHRGKFFIGSLATLAMMYYKKEKILDYICQPCFDDELEELIGGYDDNYAAFSQSGSRIYYPGEILTTFKDVAGLETAKEDLSDILMFLKNQKKFTDIGAHVPKGVLLSGAPGNGKKYHQNGEYHFRFKRWSL